MVFETWQLRFILSKATIACAYAIVGAFALHRLVSMLRARSFAGSGDVGLLSMVFLVSFALANHELVMKAHQPIHFARGHIWLALFLIGAPSFRGMLERAFGRDENAGSPVMKGVAAGACLLLLLDNAAWLSYQVTLARRGDYPGVLDQSVMELYDAMARAGIRGVALMPLLSDYPAATYTDVTPYTGHSALTPDFKERIAQRDRFYQAGDYQVLKNKSIRILVLFRWGVARKSVSLSEWGLVCETPSFQVFERR